MFSFKFALRQLREPVMHTVIEEREIYLNDMGKSRKRMSESKARFLVRLRNKQQWRQGDVRQQGEVAPRGWVA